MGNRLSTANNQRETTLLHSTWLQKMPMVESSPFCNKQNITLDLDARDTAGLNAQDLILQRSKVGKDRLRLLRLFRA